MFNTFEEGTQYLLENMKILQPDFKDLDVETAEILLMTSLFPKIEKELTQEQADHLAEHEQDEAYVWSYLSWYIKNFHSYLAESVREILHEVMEDAWDDIDGTRPAYTE